MKTFNQNIYACELNQTTGVAQRAHTAQMILKLIINKTNTFLRFQVSRFFFYTEEHEMSRFSFQKSGHSILTLSNSLAFERQVTSLQPDKLVKTFFFKYASIDYEYQ
jgi:hypothetical protein